MCHDPLCFCPVLAPPQFPMASLCAKFANCLKLHRTVALHRVRTNTMGLIAGLLVSYLLPLPSLHEAIYAVYTREYDSWAGKSIYQWFCIFGMSLPPRSRVDLTINAEITMFSLFLFNILQGIYAIRYPRASFPPITSRTKPTIATKDPISPQRPSRLLPSRVSSHFHRLRRALIQFALILVSLWQSGTQPQKPFSFSPSSSFGRSMSANYPSSPFSTPSRVVHYSVPPYMSTDTRLTSSSINFSSTPSPVVAAYRARHLSRRVGRRLCFCHRSL